MKMTTRCCPDAAMALIDDYSVDPRLRRSFDRWNSKISILRDLRRHASECLDSVKWC